MVRKITLLILQLHIKPQTTHPSQTPPAYYPHQRSIILYRWTCNCNFWSSNYSNQLILNHSCWNWTLGRWKSHNRSYFKVRLFCEEERERFFTNFLIDNYYISHTNTYSSVQFNNHPPCVIYIILLSPTLLKQFKNPKYNIIIG